MAFPKHIQGISNSLLYGCFAIVFFSCSEPAKKEEPASESKTTEAASVKQRVIPPEFNADSAYAYIKAQADMGPRVPGSKAHERCVSYMEKELKRMGAEVTIQGGSAKTYDGKQWRIDNVIASLNPKAKKRILLSAHYDSRPFADRDPDPKNQNTPVPGVNDGASGVGVLMELARIINSKPLNIGVDIVLFDLEDYGDLSGDPRTWCLGAQYWGENPHKPGYKAEYGILLDMVGAKDATFPKEGVSMSYASDIVDKVWTSAGRLGYSNYFIGAETGELTDDHLFINQLAHIKCIDIVHYIPTPAQPRSGDFFPHHHRISDDLSNIDKTTLKAVGQTLLEVLYNEAPDPADVK
ncbi:MAG: M28 family peptidase [Bacteroidia bacterium]